MNYEALHLDPEENVILEVRKHWIVFVANGIGLLFLAFVPFAVFTIMEIFVPQAFQISLHGNIVALFSFFYSLWLLLLWISFFSQWTKYYLDVWYVTQKRIIIVDQKRLFDRQISNIRFDKVQDVSIDVDGILSTFLGFGNIRVQTASEDNTEFILNTVRNPEELRKVIFLQHNEIGDISLNRRNAQS